MEITQGKRTLVEVSRAVDQMLSEAEAWVGFYPHQALCMRTPAMAYLSSLSCVESAGSLHDDQSLNQSPPSRDRVGTGSFEQDQAGSA